MRKIKQLSIMLMIVLCAPLFAGCGSSVPEPSVHEYPWTVVLHLEYDMILPTSQQNIDELATDLEEKFQDKDIEFGIGATSTKFRLALEFGGEKVINGITLESGYVELNDFFNLGMSDYNLVNLVKQEWRKSTFIRTRTLTFTNPWKYVLREPWRSGAVLDELTQIVKSAGVNISESVEPTYEYEFLSSFKRHVNDKTSMSKGAGEYRYFFAYGGEGSIETIVIEDRFENGAIWYGIAVASMAVFMVLVYVLAKRKEQRAKALESSQKQSVEENPFVS